MTNEIEFNEEELEFANQQIKKLKQEQKETIEHLQTIEHQRERVLSELRRLKGVRSMEKMK